MSLSQIVRLDGHIQSIYLAVYPDKLLLLDGCCRADVPMVLDYIHDTLQRPISHLKVVVVTHMHPDHAGGASGLKKATGCRIISSARTRQWYAGVGGQLMHLVDIGLAYYVAHRQNRRPKNLWYPAHLHPDMTVSEGDYLPDFSDWLVLDTSGHTDRDLSLFHVPSRQVYTADLIIKLRHKFVAPFPIYDPVTYAASLQKIKNMQPSKVLMAHGRELVIDAPTFDQLIANAPTERRTIKDTIMHKLLWRAGKRPIFG